MEQNFSAERDRFIHFLEIKGASLSPPAGVGGKSPQKSTVQHNGVLGPLLISVPTLLIFH